MSGIFKGEIMKTIFVLTVLISLFSLTGCLKDAAKSVGDAGNSGAETIDKTINRDKTK